MNSNRHLIVLSAALLLLLVAGANQAPPGRVGVIDLDRVFEGADKRKELQSTLASMKKEFTERMAKIDERIAQLRSDLELLEKGTTRFSSKEKELFGVIQERKYELQRFDERFKSRKAELQDQLYDEITAMVREYGAAQGFDVILQNEFAIADDDRLTWQSVVYRADDVDVTDAVIRLLNE